MAKMTRGQLKSIVKECLVEILSEGLSSDSEQSAISLKESTRTKRKERIKQEEERLRQHRQKFEVKVDDTVTNVTSDPIMQSILADTAKTTLQEQMRHEGPSSTSSPMMPANGAPAGPGIDLSDIFSGPKQNWADLAFGDVKTS
tara:strand:- start:197 stop:628 length:432 start_codon:yes stop_codon:yes gene_type:complete